MRFWHAAKSTPNALLAFSGRELRFLITFKTHQLSLDEALAFTSVGGLYQINAIRLGRCGFLTAPVSNKTR